MKRALAVAPLLFVLGTGTASVSSSSPSSPVSWTTYHDDPAGTGVEANVSKVTTTSLAWASRVLDGQLFGEPLVDGDSVYVATENDTVYALSAANGTVEWSAHLGPSVPSGALPCGDISPGVGVTGTPVIDASRREIFVVAALYVNGKPSHHLYGLSLATGKVELNEDVDPPGADPSALLQRTGLALDAGQVVFGMGGNFGDCGSYRGRVIAVAEAGGAPRVFTVDAAAGESEGAVWMGGAAPVVDRHGDIWVSTGNGSVVSAEHSYDNSDGVLELSPSLRRLQYFAPADWAADNAADRDLSTAPMLLPDGQVMIAGKSRIVYLLNGSNLGGIGGQKAAFAGRQQNGEMGTACDSNIDGGAAVQGMTVFLPCMSGIEAIRASASPPALRMLWTTSTGGGPPIVAGGLVWTIGQNGVLYGLSESSGKIEQQVAIGVPANHFPTPSAGDGLLLATCATSVVAFHAGGSASSTGNGPASSAAAAAHCAAYEPPGPGTPRRIIAAIAAGSLVVVAGIAALAWFLQRGRRRSLHA